MLIGSFNASTGWVGRTIEYEEADRLFVLQERGPIRAREVIAYAEQGQFDWADERLRSWVNEYAEWESRQQSDSTRAAAAEMEPQQAPSNAGSDSRAQSPKSFVLWYRGGHPSYPESHRDGITLQVLADRLELAPAGGWFAGLSIPFADVQDFALQRRTGQRGTIQIRYRDVGGVVCLTFMMPGLSEAKRCRDLADRLRAAGISEVTDTELVRELTLEKRAKVQSSSEVWRAWQEDRLPSGGRAWIDRCPACFVATLHGTSEGDNSTVWTCAHCGAEFLESAAVPGKYWMRSAGTDGSGQFAELCGEANALTPQEWSTVAWERRQAVVAALEAKEKRAKEEAARREDSDLASFLTDVIEGVVTIGVGDRGSPVALKSGEHVCIVVPGLTLREPRTVSQGVYGGPRIRVSKHLSFNVGGFRAAPHEELKDVDRGDFILTNKRFVFLGGKRTVSANLSLVVGVEPYKDAVAIHRSNKQRMEMFWGIRSTQVKYHIEGRTREYAFNGGVLGHIIEYLASYEPPKPEPAKRTTSKAAPRSAANELAKLAKLKDSGVISEDEFSQLKAKVLQEFG